MNNSRWLFIALIGAIVLLAVLNVSLVFFGPKGPAWDDRPQAQEPSFGAQTYVTDCYMEQGGSKFVCGSGGEIEVQSGATLDVQSGATFEASAGLDLNGNTLTIDADADTTLAAGTDDVIAVTLGAATGKVNVLTGNLAVGNGTPSTTLNGEDAYVEGTFEADGAARFDGAVTLNSTLDAVGNVSSGTGAFTITDNVMVDGQADAVQMTVQGNATQTSLILVVENSAGTDQFTVGNTGNVKIEGTLGVDGSVSDTDSVLTMADNVLVDGAEDAIQMTVQGNATQTTSLLVLEQSDGTDVLTVSNAGNLVVAGTSDLKGNVSDSGGDFTIADNVVVTGTSDLQGNVSDSGGTFTVADDVLIDGAADAVQLTVQGNATQTSSILVVENSAGTDQFTVGNTGNVKIEGTLAVDGALSDTDSALTVADNVLVDGAEDAIQMTIQGNATQTTGLLVLEQSDGTDVLTVSNAGNMVVAGTSDLKGNVSSSTGAFTVTDNVVIDGAADVIQLTVQGNATQTSNVLVVEQSDGTDKFTVTNVGNTTVAGTSDLQGNVSDSGGTFTVADDVLIDGQADAVQLTVQGNATQTANVLVVEQSDGTDKFTVTNVGNTAVGGTLSVTGASTFSGGATTTGIHTFSAATSITVTNGAAFAPTGTYQPITAAGTVTPTITIPAAGVTTCLINTSAQTINIADTGNQVFAGAVALGQYDVLCYISDGTRVIEVTRSNN